MTTQAAAIGQCCARLVVNITVSSIARELNGQWRNIDNTAVAIVLTLVTLREHQT